MEREQYLTYTEYLELGGNLDVVPFNLLELEVRKRIDEKTFGRLIGKGHEYKEVKACEYALMNEVSTYSSASNGFNLNVSRETIDGYSIDYVTLSHELLMARANSVGDIIETYLSTLEIDGVPVLYRGV